MFGAGLYMAGLALLAAAVGLLVRHTAAAISIVLALVFIIGNRSCSSSPARSASGS